MSTERQMPELTNIQTRLGFELSSSVLTAFSDELQKIAGAGSWITGHIGRAVGKGLENDPIARKSLANGVTKGLGEKLMAGPSRAMELLKGGKHTAVHGPEKLVAQPKALGLFSRKPKMMPTIEHVRPGNTGGVYSGKTQSIVPHEAQDEALKSTLARGAVGAGALYAGSKAVKSLKMPPEDEYPKYANLGAMGSMGTLGTAPGNPSALTEVKSTIPNKPLSGKTPKYSKVLSAPTPTSAASHQPVSAAPPVRA